METNEPKPQNKWKPGSLLGNIGGQQNTNQEIIDISKSVKEMTEILIGKNFNIFEPISFAKQVK